ncbi:hypothetical protein H0H93_014329, partial [Arthromyces matolae]
MEYRTYDYESIDYNYDPSVKPSFDPYTDEQQEVNLTLAPSSSYLSIASFPSKRLPSPSLSRKLLILDLNGTLVYRSPHVRRSTRYDPAQRPLRTAHPRPYMPSFRSYLFHQSTRAWLDTMVWSSAQPHSVNDMVQKSFNSHQSQLVAIWARDTLGLEETDYHRKVQTTKDLSKAWSKLPLSHSARTTLLLDDSPLKAILQPYNHLCIREYTGALRQNDLQSYQREAQARIRTDPLSPSPIMSPSLSPTIPNSIPPSEPPIEDSDPAISELPPKTKKRRRPKDKKSKSSMSTSNSSQPTSTTLDILSAGYDITLLAVIGILEAL